MREKVTQIQEAQKVPNKMNPKRPTPRHIIMKMAKFKHKEKILKTAREKQLVTYKETTESLSADFSTEILQTRRERQKIFQEMKNKGLKTKLCYTARLSYKMEGETRIFTGNK